MFVMSCGNGAEHGPHSHSKCWIKSELPDLPTHVAAQLPDQWDAEYLCNGASLQQYFSSGRSELDYVEIEDVGSPVIDGLFGPETLFAVQVWKMSEVEAKLAAREQHHLRLVAERAVAKLERKIRKLKRSKHGA